MLLIDSRPFSISLNVGETLPAFVKKIVKSKSLKAFKRDWWPPIRVRVRVRVRLSREIGGLQTMRRRVGRDDRSSHGT